MPEPITGYVNTAFPKGNALADWLMLVAATSVRTELEIWQGQHSVAGVVAPTQAWITVPQNPNEDNLPSIQYMTFNAPVGAPATSQCGRGAFADMHVNTPDRSDPALPFPTGCGTAERSTQAKAVSFLLFELAGCVMDDALKPVAPPVQ